MKFAHCSYLKTLDIWPRRLTSELTLRRDSIKHRDEIKLRNTLPRSRSNELFDIDRKAQGLPMYFFASELSSVFAPRVIYPDFISHFTQYAIFSLRSLRYFGINSFIAGILPSG